MSDHPALEFATAANLEWATLFHNHVKHAMEARLSLFMESEKLSDSDKNYWKEVYTNQFSKELRVTTFLLFFGHLEETLFNLCKVKKYDQSKLSKGYGVGRFKPMIKELLPYSLSSYKPYEVILDAQYIRNSFLHVAGRVSLSKDNQAINSVLKKRSTDYIMKHDRVQVTPEGLLKLQSSIKLLCIDLLSGKLIDN
ncbi:hypothetical protein [Alteromonas stellipolaris]|uniref:RiboL-PSP-HEPN domain-containing protein n=1 Tax=Alteromonas stellipolaris TaxID=233316 RepID=A0AAW7YV86_9ALTE|nr:hypothetical protein [Alteromonas stellipolaris]MDO6533949.1 hypothetical protein [Alteromonas stellipolaris]MDO6576081.1 hypothetical protein [Alteromonas stellipolaris]MDO6626157.1 hypothetical protein [Alteromonas stellipolaris]